ncbi:sulfite exporter TauE/SafE family protein [Helicobacter pylori]|uniref:sulfite exporter TauE/SafE family protein n=1 Tax=Helicobacter pylori TaxID=210 RepID=UPI001FD70598|nr:sulfite exporter TauE/SafE family protein [Helicobacter pylori]UOS33511.1 sulfite exporter TauE/SafE family protein [Helicobacter pylori]
MDIYALYIAIGLFTGILSGIFGIGGGMIIVPIMLATGHSFEESIGISILQMALSSFVGSVLNFKKKSLDFSLGLLIGAGGLIGASFSGFVLKIVSSKILMVIFSLLVVYSMIQFVLKPKKKDFIADTKQRYHLQGLKLFLIGVLTGFFAITLGIGGGMLMVPLMHYFLGYDSKKCVALGLFFILFSSISGAFSLIYHHIINKEVLLAGAIVGLGSVIGVSIGIKWIMGLLNEKMHKILILGVYGLSLLIVLYKLFF